MQIYDEEINDYLSGVRFSNGLTVRIPDQLVTGRLDTVCDLVKGKAIIHFGYCDHLPLVQKKIDKGVWLHALLTDLADRCIGLDIDTETVQAIERDFGVKNGFAFDLFQDQVPDAVKTEQWEYLIMGEILEHVDNPVAFLKELGRKFLPHVSKIVITVPNAYDFTAQRFFKDNSECINTDHRYWFTPYTLVKVAFLAGLKLERILMCDEGLETSFWRRRAIKKCPLRAETILGIFSENKPCKA